MTRMTAARMVCALALLPAFAATASIPLAHCRKNDKTESGLQGLTTPQEIAQGKAVQGFNCNTDLVGQYQGEGASWQLTAWKNCAYFDQRLASAELQHPGTVVVDVSDPKNPKPTAWLDDNAMLDPWESLKVNPQRQLLAAAQRPSTGFSIYDISQDCAHPVKKAFIDIPGAFGHTGQWAPDGKTYYITPLRVDQTIIVVDTNDVSKPKVIPCTKGSYGCQDNGFFLAPVSDFGTPRWHDLEFSKDGNTAYISMLATGTGAPDPRTGQVIPSGANGLVIMDVSDFQQRRPNPSHRLLGKVTWDDGSIGAQNALFITVKGKPYVLFTDESGAAVTECSKGKSAAGFPRLIDVSDPKNPKTVSKLVLDIHDPANCNVAATTAVTANSGSSGPFGFSCHYCNVDDQDNAKIAACSCFAAGWRFFDISDVTNPREIAYYKPPAQGTKVLKASQYWNSSFTSPQGGPNFVRNFDWATSKPSFPKDRGATSGDVWITTQDNGFMVLKLDSNATASSGGGCASVDASLGGLLVFGLVEALRRRRARRR